MPTPKKPEPDPRPIGDPVPTKPLPNPEPIQEPPVAMAGTIPQFFLDPDRRMRVNFREMSASKKVDDRSKHESKHESNPKQDPLLDPKLDPRHDPKHDPKPRGEIHPGVLPPKAEKILSREVRS